MKKPPCDTPRSRHSSRFIVSSLTAIWLSFFLIAQDTGKSQAHTEAQRPIRIAADAVLLDVVIRDKRGKPLEDLKPSEVEVFEDGVRQTIQFFDRSDAVSQSRSRLEGQIGATGIGSERQIHLVTLLFDQLNIEGRQLSRLAALDFLRQPLPDNVLVAVFKTDRAMYALQQFTNNRDLLRVAVEKATGGGYSQFASQSAAIKLEAEKMAALQNTAERIAAATRPGEPPPRRLALVARDAKIAEIMLNMLRATESLQREQQGHASLYGLLGLIREQRQLPGRKTVIYFSEGLQAPPNMVEVLRATISEANRANVSVYAVDARGLVSARLSQAGTEMLEQTASASQRQMVDGGRHFVTREEALITENAEASLRMNTQETLADLAKSTGGALIADTNDASNAMRKVREDIQMHYELAYVPQNRSYDGKFRSISVKVSRPSVTIQTRSGYFALPPDISPSVMPFEVPLLASLSTSPPAREFEYRSAAFHFRSEPDGVQHSLILEVPLSSFRLTPQADGKTHRARISLLALVKDSAGNIVRKFTQDSPLEAVAEQTESLKKRHFVLMRSFLIPPGRYTVETVAMDRESSRASVKRSVLVVLESTQSVSLSSLAVVKRIDPVPPDRMESDDPFRLGNAKIIPNVGETFHREEARGLSLFFVVYAQRNSTQPELTLELEKDGRIVALANPPLPAPDAKGQIPYLATIPIDSLGIGRYGIRVIVRQESSVAMERTVVNLEK